MTQVRRVLEWLLGRIAALLYWVIRRYPVASILAVFGIAIVAEWVCRIRNLLKGP